MSENNPFRVYVVHTHSEHPEYLRVFEYLESRGNFFYRNCTDIKAGVQGDNDTIRAELRRQMSTAEIVLFPVNLFAEQPVLVSFQIDAAKFMGKPVLAIKSFGETNIVKKSVLDKADDIVDWNDRSITEAIKKLARNDQSGQWETIEFKLD
ncbi:MAG: hypothetical protein FJ197_04945 [Gammaproteobacteria bacterium]|nr:hypothetical protein [Gammaproteobacteria bacterium]